MPKHYKKDAKFTDLTKAEKAALMMKDIKAEHKSGATFYADQKRAEKSARPLRKLSEFADKKKKKQTLKDVAKLPKKIKRGKRNLKEILHDHLEPYKERRTRKGERFYLKHTEADDRKAKAKRDFIHKHHKPVTKKKK